MEIICSLINEEFEKDFVHGFNSSHHFTSRICYWLKKATTATGHRLSTLSSGAEGKKRENG